MSCDKRCFIEGPFTPPMKICNYKFTTVFFVNTIYTYNKSESKQNVFQ